MFFCFISFKTSTNLNEVNTKFQNNRHCRCEAVEALCFVLSVISLAETTSQLYKSMKLLEKKFSNSLIIHQVKTKEITTVKEVWIPGLN